MRFKYAISILRSLCQIGLFVLVYELLWFIASQALGDVRKDLSWGLTLRYAIIVFCVLSLLLNLGLLLLKSKKGKMVLIIAAMIVFVIFFIPNLLISPYRTSLLFLSSLLAFSLSFFMKSKKERSSSI